MVARVPYKGPVADVLYQLTGGLRSGMGYCGAASLDALHKARFVKISPATVQENHPHDVTIAKKHRIIKYSRVFLRKFCNFESRYMNIGL